MGSEMCIRDRPDGDLNLNLIGCIGGTSHDGVVNTIMLGISPDPAQPVVTFSLVYVPPGQFASAETESGSSNS